MVAGAAQNLMISLAKEQEIIMGIADMAIWAYTAESIVLRVQKQHKASGDSAVELPLEIMQTYVHSAADKINVAGHDALMGFAEGDELR